MTETLRAIYQAFLSVFERFTSPSSNTGKNVNGVRHRSLKRRNSRYLDKCDIEEDIVEINPKKKAKKTDHGKNEIHYDQDKDIASFSEDPCEMENRKTSQKQFSSSWVCKKPKEPSVKLRNPSIFPITRRKPLHPEEDQLHQHSCSPERDNQQIVVVDEEYNKELHDRDGSFSATGNLDSSLELSDTIKSTNRNNSEEADLSYQISQIGRSKTIDKVVRLYERDAYKEIVRNYVYYQNLLSTGYDDEGSSRPRPLVRQPHSDYHENEDHPRFRKADEILSRLSFALADTTKSSVSVSSTRITPDTSLLQETINSSREDQGFLSMASKFTRADKNRAFSGADTMNVARAEVKTAKSQDTFGGALTKKLRNILDTIETERREEISKEERKLDDIAKKRRERDLRLLKRIDERKEMERRKTRDKIPELTSEMESMVTRALGPGDSSACLVEGFNITITRHDITTLADLNWLNDEVVNFYFNLLKERSNKPGRLKIHFFNSFFYPKLLKTGYSGVRRWTKKVDIFSVDIIVLPIHLGMHWCLAAIDMKKKRIAYYDSLKGDNRQCLSSLRNYLMEEHKDKKKTAIDIAEWKLELERDIPQQLNGCDCGVFTCKYADYITRGSKLTFGQENMPNFRRIMIYEILTKKLLQ